MYIHIPPIYTYNIRIYTLYTCSNYTYTRRTSTSPQTDTPIRNPYIRAPLFLRLHPLQTSSLSLCPRPAPCFTARVYVTRGAMLHRATWKFSSLRVHTRTYVEGARVRGSVPAGVWGALRLDRSVNGTARPARACVCVGGGAHRGTCWWPSENAFDVYHPPGTRPADYISRDRADFTNTGRVEYVRAPNGGPPLRSTHVVDREEGVAPNPLFLPPPAPSRDPQRSDSFFLSSLRYVRLIHAFPGGQAW